MWKRASGGLSRVQSQRNGNGIINKDSNDNGKRKGHRCKFPDHIHAPPPQFRPGPPCAPADIFLVRSNPICWVLPRSAVVEEVHSATGILL